MVISSARSPQSVVARPQIPVNSFRRVPSPDPEHPEQSAYIAIVNVRDLPDLAGWRRINVRDAKLTGAVPKAIRQTLEETPGMFVFMNATMINSGYCPTDTRTPFEQMDRFLKAQEHAKDLKRGLWSGETLDK